MAGKQHKTGEENTDKEAWQKHINAPNAAQCKPVRKPECDQDTQNEYADIQNKTVFAQNESINIVQGRNQQCSENDSPT